MKKTLMIELECSEKEGKYPQIDAKLTSFFRQLLTSYVGETPTFIVDNLISVEVI